MTNEQALSALQHLIGAVYTEDLKTEVAAITGRARIVGPGDIATREINPNRIMIRVDTEGKVSSFVFQ